MNVRCQKITRQIDRWLELSDQEQRAIRRHAQDCSACSEALESIEQVLRTLDQSVVDYSRLKYSGLVPSLPERSPAWLRFFPSTPAWRWAAVAATLVLALVWFGANLLPTSDTAKSQSFIQPLQMPPMPSQAPSMASIPLSPGELSLQVIRLKRKVGPSLHRNIRIPSRPEEPKIHLREETRMQNPYRA